MAAAAQLGPAVVLRVVAPEAFPRVVANLSHHRAQKERGLIDDKVSSYQANLVRSSTADSTYLYMYVEVHATLELQLMVVLV